MKKQIKISALAVALLASVTAAYGTDIASAFAGKKTSTYLWIKYNRDGSVDTNTPSVISVTNPYSECTGDQEVCAIGRDLTDPNAEPQIFRYPELP